VSIQFNGCVHCSPNATENRREYEKRVRATVETSWME
jgi:hypothetical protein